MNSFPYKSVDNSVDSKTWHYCSVKRNLGLCLKRSIIDNSQIIDDYRYMYKYAASPDDQYFHDLTPSWPVPFPHELMTPDIDVKHFSHSPAYQTSSNCYPIGDNNKWRFISYHQPFPGSKNRCFPCINIRTKSVKIAHNFPLWQKDATCHLIILIAVISNKMSQMIFQYIPQAALIWWHLVCGASRLILFCDCLVGLSYPNIMPKCHVQMSCIHYMYKSQV